MSDKDIERQICVTFRLEFIETIDKNWNLSEKYLLNTL